MTYQLFRERQGRFGRRRGVALKILRVTRNNPGGKNYVFDVLKQLHRLPGKETKSGAPGTCYPEKGNR